MYSSLPSLPTKDKKKLSCHLENYKIHVYFEYDFPSCLFEVGIGFEIGSNGSFICSGAYLCK